MCDLSKKRILLGRISPFNEYQNNKGEKKNLERIKRPAFFSIKCIAHSCKPIFFFNNCPAPRKQTDT